MQQQNPGHRHEGTRLEEALVGGPAGGTHQSVSEVSSMTSWYAVSSNSRFLARFTAMLEALLHPDCC